MGQRKFERAEEALLNTHSTLEDQFGPDDWRTQNARQALAKLYADWGAPQKAQAFLDNDN